MRPLRAPKLQPRRRETWWGWACLCAGVGVWSPALFFHDAFQLSDHERVQSSRLTLGFRAGSLLTVYIPNFFHSSGCPRICMVNPTKEEADRRYTGRGSRGNQVRWSIPGIPHFSFTPHSPGVISKPPDPRGGGGTSGPCCPAGVFFFCFPRPFRTKSAVLRPHQPPP